MELMIDEKPLTPAEQNRLGELEIVIRENLKAWYAVGMAMIEIRESRLYRNDEGRTWEAYCREIFDMSHQHADRQIAAAKVIENLTPIGVKEDGQVDWELLPANEAQARELARLKPEEQQQVWKDIIEGKKIEEVPPKITAKEVKLMVKRFKGTELSKAIAKAVSGVKPKQKIDAARESEEFKLAWVELMDQIEAEGRNGWKTTSREVVFKALMRLVEVVGNGSGPWLQDKKIPLRLQNREKLFAAGWLLLRKGASGLTIEQLCDDGSWLLYGEYESEEQCEEAFMDALLESKTIQV